MNSESNKNTDNRPIFVASIAVAMLTVILGRGVSADEPKTLLEAVDGRFDIGVGIGWRAFRLPENRELVVKHFNYVTPENCMKFASTQPAEGRFRFQKADEFIRLAEDNGLKVLGHCLIWAKDDRTPEWFYREDDQQVQPEVLMQRMKTHIKTVVERYKGRVHSWDVVNEAIGERGDEYLRDSVWANLLDDDFIVEAFRYTHELDPEALLVYNDYHLHEPWRRERMERLVKRLQQQKVQIDAIGIQGHYNLNAVPYEQLEELLILLRTLNVKITISELDIDMIPRGGWWADGGKNRESLAKYNPYPKSCPPELLERQAEQYAKLFDLFQKYEDVILRVSFWNIHDGESWLNHFPWNRVNYPLLFDRARRPKPAFHAVIKSLTDHPAIQAEDGITTGAFHLGKVNGRDCLVTPDGKPFLSLGINHIQALTQKGEPDLFASKFNRDRTKASEAALAHLRAMGFNTAGYGAFHQMRAMIPFMADSFLTKNSNFLPESEFFYPDIFAPRVQDEIRKKLRNMCGVTDNPNLIGYYWTDTPQWDLRRAQRKRGTDWVSTIRELPVDAPGRKRYEQFLADCAAAGVPADDDGFLRLIAREYYKVVGEETRRLHRGALIFGERYLVNDHPACVLEEAMPYIDVLSIQPGGAKCDGDYLDRLHAKYEKPILLCDHQVRFPAERYPKTMWQQLKSEEAAGLAYAQYLKDAFAKPYVIGYHRCQYIDRFATYQGVLKQGVLREDGTPYKTLVEITREANLEAIRNFEAACDSGIRNGDAAGISRQNSRKALTALPSAGHAVCPRMHTGVFDQD